MLPSRHPSHSGSKQGFLFGSNGTNSRVGFSHFQLASVGWWYQSPLPHRIQIRLCCTSEGKMSKGSRWVKCCLALSARAWWEGDGEENFPQILLTTYINLQDFWKSSELNITLRVCNPHTRYFYIQDWVYTHRDIRWSPTSVQTLSVAATRFQENCGNRRGRGAHEIVHTLRDIFSDCLHGLAAQLGTCICAFFSDVRPSAGAESKQSMRRLFILSSNSLRLKIGVMIFLSV